LKAGPGGALNSGANTFNYLSHEVRNMNKYLIMAGVAIVAVAVAKKLPVVKDHL
jgi:hypothetical protein